MAKHLLDRRRFMQAGLASVAAAACRGPRASSPAPRAARAQPNVVFILADDLGYADLSSYGRRDYTTPNIDRLATDGLKLTQAYASSAVCSPTRLALITGRYQYRLGLGLEEPLTPESPKDAGLPPEHPTLPSLLKQRGYDTALVGKWHLGFPPAFGPRRSGYDHFFGIHAGAADYFEHGPQTPSPLYDDEVKVDQHGYMTELLGDHAVKFIDDHATTGRPFLLSLHFTAPHWPWEGPGDEGEARRIRNLWDFDGGSLQTYAAMVRSMDEQVGRVLQTLDRHDLARDTIVIFTSDNGGERFSDMWPFSGMKGELLEGGLRVPALVRWPGRIAPSTTSSQVTMSFDWLPTLLAAAGGAPDPAFPPDGENLLPVLTGSAPPHARTLFWRFGGMGQHAMRDGDWKYLRLAGNTFLFDVVKDPRERANLKDRYPEVFARLEHAWESWNATMIPQAVVGPGRDPGAVYPDRYQLSPSLRDSQ